MYCRTLMHCRWIESRKCLFTQLCSKVSCKCRCKNAGMRICKIVSGEANDGSLLSKEKLMNDALRFIIWLIEGCFLDCTRGVLTPNSELHTQMTYVWVRAIFRRIKSPGRGHIRQVYSIICVFTIHSISSQLTNLFHGQVKVSQAN